MSEEVDFRSRGPRITIDLTQFPKANITANRSWKGNLECREDRCRSVASRDSSWVIEAARRDRSAPVGPIGADIKFVLLDPAIRAAILTRQIAESAYAIGGAQIDLNLVRRRRRAVQPLTMPEGTRFSVKGVSGGIVFSHQLLAVYKFQLPISLRDDGIALHQ